MSDLLPSNASDQERAISEAIERAGAVPVVVREVWNPDTCPSAILPWLAWAFSLDEWNPNWSDEQKRGAIKAGIAVHQRKGTIGALRAALNGLGLNLKLTEWFQKAPMGNPYTLSVDIVVEQEPIGGLEDFNRIEAVVESTKNLRSHLDALNVKAITRGTEYFAAKCIMGETVNISSEPSP